MSRLTWHQHTGLISAAMIMLGLIACSTFGGSETPAAISRQPTAALPSVAPSLPAPTVPDAAPTTPTPIVATPTPIFTRRPSICTLSAQFVADVTIPDHTALEPGTAFTKTWRVKNTGTCDWTTHYRLNLFAGTPMGTNSTALPYTPAGSEANVSVRLVAPTAAGTYFNVWRLVEPAGGNFSQLTVIIVVPSPTPSAMMPTPTIKDIAAAYQPFENGFMIWLGDRKHIWIALCCTSTDPTGGVWLVYPDTYTDDMRDSDPSIVPPNGLYQPVRGFGLAWRTITDSRSSETLRKLLGWATAPELGYTAHLEYYPGGFIDANGGFNGRPGNWKITLPTGKSYYFHEAGPAWSLVQP